MTVEGVASGPVGFRDAGVVRGAVAGREQATLGVAAGFFAGDGARDLLVLCETIEPMRVESSLTVHGM